MQIGEKGGDLGEGVQELSPVLANFDSRGYEGEKKR